LNGSNENIGGTAHTGQAQANNSKLVQQPRHEHEYPNMFIPPWMIENHYASPIATVVGRNFSKTYLLDKRSSYHDQE
jgi:hypothetical protein